MDEFDDVPPAVRDFLRTMFGEHADDALAQLRASGMDLDALAQLPGMDATPAQMQAMISRAQDMMARAGDDPVNWEMAHQVARERAAAGGDRVVGPAEEAGVAADFAVAELWLDPVTDFGPAPGPIRAWSSSQWVEATLPAWRPLMEPVASAVTTALSAALGETGELGEVAGMFGESFDPTVFLRQVGAAVFAMQVGQAAGTAARAVFGGTDLGLPLVTERAVLPRVVSEFADGLDIDAKEVRLYLTVREAARSRLFAHVPWLRGHMFATVEAFARGITIDIDQISDAVSGIDASNVEALQEAISHGVFAPSTTPAQEEALERLETSLALVEGWVDYIANRATAAHLPGALRVAEMVQRRRAAGGPAEQAFATLVGLELRPRRARDAAAFFAALEAQGGPQQRDGVWAHPDLLPGPAALDDPTTYQAQSDEDAQLSADLDAALADILGDGDDDPTA